MKKVLTFLLSLASLASAIAFVVLVVSGYLAPQASVGLQAQPAEPTPDVLFFALLGVWFVVWLACAIALAREVRR